MTNNTPKISIIIPTKNRFDDITKSIGSILIQTLLPDEIVIVDASDTQKLNGAIKRQVGDKLKTIYIHSKAGLTYQRNVGVKASSGDVVIFLDDDVILDRNFIKEIMHIFNNDLEKKVGGVMGDIINQNQSLTRSIKKTFSTILTTTFFLCKHGNGKFRLSGFPTYPHGVNKILNIESLSGGLTAYRREVLNEFEFDENLHGYCYMEDDDFSYRVSRKYKNVYTPYAKVIHNSPPIASDKKYARMKQLIENHYYLFKKNIPKSFQYKFAFCMSIIGLFVMEMIDTMIRRDKNGLKGLMSGIIDIKRNKRKIKVGKELNNENAKEHR
jgi:GT2 family glycosyltransferase